MKTDINEMLSAMMDGDLLSGRHSEHVNEISNDDELKQKWYRYHLIRDALQGHLDQDVDCQLSERIRTAIDNEPAILAPAASRKRSYLKPVAGFAIAASVAVAVLLGIQMNNRPAETETVPAFASNTTPRVSQPVQFVSGNSRTELPPARAAESPMNRYLVNYNESRLNSGVRGMLPYVRIVGHETNR